jgi:hypothetical protein
VFVTCSRLLLNVLMMSDDIARLERAGVDTLVEGLGLLVHGSAPISVSRSKSTVEVHEFAM